MYICELDEEEDCLYMELCDNGKYDGGTGAVDGKDFGYDGSGLWVVRMIW